jgi:hypothetical protein
MLYASRERETAIDRNCECTVAVAIAIGSLKKLEDFLRILKAMSLGAADCLPEFY